MPWTHWHSSIPWGPSSRLEFFFTHVCVAVCTYGTNLLLDTQPHLPPSRHYACPPPLCLHPPPPPPAILASWPPAGPPGGQVNTFGYPGYVTNDACKSAVASSADGDMSCLGAVRVGDYLCATDAASYALSSDTPAGGGGDPFIKWRYMWSWLYRINCTVPVPVGCSLVNAWRYLRHGQAYTASRTCTGYTSG